MEKQMSFFNTIELPPSELSEATGKAIMQEDRVLKIFQGHDRLTPIEAHKIYELYYPPCPLTSIRRSITVLTEKKKLQKTSEMKKELYGKPNYYWICLK